MADQKLTQLTLESTITDDDLFYLVDDPAGTPLSRKTTASDLAAYLSAENLTGTDNRITRFDTPDGVQDSDWQISDTGQLLPINAANDIGDGTEYVGDVFLAEARFRSDVNNLFVTDDDGNAAIWADNVSTGFETMYLTTDRDSFVTTYAGIFSDGAGTEGWEMTAPNARIAGNDSAVLQEIKIDINGVSKILANQTLTKLTDASGNSLIDIRGTSQLGFFGTTGIAKPTATGSRGGNAALASLLTQLANLGLITDSTVV